MDAQAVRVVYIGGYSRSGATVLGRILGRVPGFVTVGELGYIWTRGVRENRLCGCGARFHDCEFWRQVGREAFGGWRELDLDGVLALDRGLKRHRFVPFLLAPRLSPEYRRRLQSYVGVLARVYRAIQTVSGAHVVVDSTLDPTYAMLLRHAAALDLRVVHLVRDSRGTAFSWMKRIKRPDTVGTAGYLRTYPPASTALRWTVDHILVHLLSRLTDGELLMRYESMVANPRPEVARILSYAGESADGAERPFLEDRVVNLATDHTVAGNRIRFVKGAFPLRVDDEWKTALDGVQRRLVTLISLPLLLAYGYVPAGDTRTDVA
jgi:Sulfotransferase domain